MPMINLPQYPTTPSLGRASTALAGPGSLSSELQPFLNVGGSMPLDPGVLTLAGRYRFGTHISLKSPEEQASIMGNIRMQRLTDYVNNRLAEGYTRVNNNRLTKTDGSYTTTQDIDWATGNIDINTVGGGTSTHSSTRITTSPGEQATTTTTTTMPSEVKVYDAAGVDKTFAEAQQIIKDQNKLIDKFNDQNINAQYTVGTGDQRMLVGYTAPTTTKSSGGGGSSILSTGTSANKQTSSALNTINNAFMSNLNPVVAQSFSGQLSTGSKSSGSGSSSSSKSSGTTTPSVSVSAAVYKASGATTGTNKTTSTNITGSSGFSASNFANVVKSNTSSGQGFSSAISGFSSAGNTTSKATTPAKTPAKSGTKVGNLLRKIF